MSSLLGVFSEFSKGSIQTECGVDSTHIKVNYTSRVFVVSIGASTLLLGVVRLHPFLLYQLERATDHTAEARPGPGVSRAEMHPVLYPILLLLARLKTGGGSNSMDAEQAEVIRAGIGEKCDLSSLFSFRFDGMHDAQENRRCPLCRV